MLITKLGTSKDDVVGSLAGAAQIGSGIVYGSSLPEKWVINNQTGSNKYLIDHP